MESSGDVYMDSQGERVCEMKCRGKVMKSRERCRGWMGERWCCGCGGKIRRYERERVDGWSEKE